MLLLPGQHDLGSLLGLPAGLDTGVSGSASHLLANPTVLLKASVGPDLGCLARGGLMKFGIGAGAA